MPKKEAEPQKVKIKLAYPHEHADMLHPAGAEIEVWPDQAERIKVAEAARRAAESAPACLPVGMAA